MATACKDGVYQLENGCWGYRFSILIDGRQVAKKKTTDAMGNKLKTQHQAVKAREAAIRMAHIESQRKTLPPSRRTVKEVYLEYCQNGRKDRAFSTVRKQECLWQNHIASRFGHRYVDEISVAEVTDYLKELYYDNNLSFMYVESFLKMFYLIFGQAYSRNYLDVDNYNKLCVNKDTKIHMPKMKGEDAREIKSFNHDELALLDEYFRGKNIKIGELYKSSTKEVVLLDVEVSDKVYVNGNERSDDFLSPFEPDTNDRFKRSTDENKRPVVVKFTVQNLSKADMVIVPDGITVDYNDGFEYWAESVYARTTDGVWEEFGLFANNGQLTLEKLTSGTVEVRTVVWVPSEVVEDVNSSLVLTFLGCRYEIR